MSVPGGSPLTDDSPSRRGREPERTFAHDFANTVNLESPILRPSSRRPTFNSTRRTISPPNSVKAFANARRRGQDNVVQDPKPGRRQEGNFADEEGCCATEEHVDSSSARSSHSRSHNHCSHQTPKDLVAATRPAETNAKASNQKDRLHIDFDYLETLIDVEEHDGLAERDFTNLPDTSIPTSTPMFTSDGDFIDVTSDHASITAEKNNEPSNLPNSGPNSEQSRFNYFSSALESTIHASQFGDLILPGENIRSLFEIPEGEPDGVWWLNMNNPTGNEVWTICKAFGIHPLTIEDIIHQESREKIELFPSYYFACFRSFSVIEEPDETDYRPFNVYVVVFREGTISFSFTPNQHASRVRFRISQLKEQVSLSSDWICYALM